MRLDGRTALITGGTQGVGAAIAHSLAAAGCAVILQGLRDDAVAQQTLAECRQLGGKAELVCADLVSADPAKDAHQVIDDFVARVDQVSTEVSLLVNNAGTYREEPFLEMTHAAFHRTMQLNVYAGFFLTQAYARRWVAQKTAGRVLFTGSINGELAEADHAAYDTSKGAVRMMVRSLCVALAPHGIRVNAIAPGLVVTPLTAPALEPHGDGLQWMQWHTPNGRVPGAEVCGGAALFLLSDHAEHIHGQTLLVDGGMSVWQQPEVPISLRGKLHSVNPPSHPTGR
jgi:NAD(P)-dependent dehydrogenase (short-subunit alcohol dehydrogenase family)